MDSISHAEQHREFPTGTPVVALDGETLGKVREVYDHFILVQQDDNPNVDLEVPPHAIVRFDGERLHLGVNRRALSVVDVVEATSEPIEWQSSRD